MATAPMLAFLHGRRALREFVWGNPPAAWVEVDPGSLLRGGGQAVVVVRESARRRHGSTAADVVTSRQNTLQFYADVRVFPGVVPARIRVDLGRRFDGWRSQRGYRWAIDPDAPTPLALLTRSGTPVPNGQIPTWWQTPLAALTTSDLRVHVDRAPVVVYQAHAPDRTQAMLDLARVEAMVLVAAGAKPIDCPAGHPFLWVGASGRPGRISRQWCPEHRREVRTLVMRYSRHGKPADLQALERLGYEAKTVRRSVEKRGQRKEKNTFRR